MNNLLFLNKISNIDLNSVLNDKNIIVYTFSDKLDFSRQILNSLEFIEEIDKIYLPKNFSSLNILLSQFSEKVWEIELKYFDIKLLSLLEIVYDQVVLYSDYELNDLLTGVNRNDSV
jgi:hypothetical protein